MFEQLGPQFQAGALSVLRLSIWLVILVAIFVPLERLFATRPERVLRKGAVTDLCYYFLNSLMTASFLSVPVAFLAWSVHQTIPAVFLAWSSGLPFGWRVVTAFVAGEVGYYWGHRLCHEIPFLWRFHAIHHSAEHIDFLVNTRAHPIDMVFGRFCGLVPIYVLGLSGPAVSSGESVPAFTARGIDMPFLAPYFQFLVPFVSWIASFGITVPLLATLIATVWGFFIHANLNWRFGPLEWLISTPAFHHWHHTLTPINRNYASTLPWLDRIFGTHYLPQEFPEVYGIKGKIPDSILDQLAYPLDSEPAATEDVRQTKVESPGRERNGSK